MGFVDAVINFLRATFRALTEFLGEYIPFLSDFEGFFAGRE